MECVSAYFFMLRDPYARYPELKCAIPEGLSKLNETKFYV